LSIDIVQLGKFKNCKGFHAVNLCLNLSKVVVY
jgi:hypothetical protein